VSASLPEDARDLIEELLAHDARFLVVGAHALAVHGYSRGTADFDVLVSPLGDNPRRVLAALVAFGASVAAHRVTVADFSHPGTVYQIGLPPRRIDILTKIDGVEFEEAWAGRRVETVDGLALAFLGRAELLKNKRATGRTKDLADVEALEALAPDA